MKLNYSVLTLFFLYIASSLQDQNAAAFVRQSSLPFGTVIQKQRQFKIATLYNEWNKS